MATNTMKAMVLRRQNEPLEYTELPIPVPDKGQFLVKVFSCGVCRTDLHVVDGELKDPALPLIPGHEIVGEIVDAGPGANRFPVGTKVGIPWLGWTCGQCKFCKSTRENLCDKALFTGYTLQGGYAQYTLCYQDYCVAVPEQYDPLEAAPLLCAGLIGYRSLRMAGDAKRIGLYGFGASAHIVAQICTFQGREVFAFTRPGDNEKQEFAKRLGAVWAGGSDQIPPVTLDAAIIFAPAGHLVTQALKVISKGAKVVCAGIYMSDIPSFPYEDLWWERQILTVANLTRQDGIEFMKIAPKVPIRTSITPYELKDANQALSDLRTGRLKGAAVLRTT